MEIRMSSRKVAVRARFAACLAVWLTLSGCSAAIHDITTDTVDPPAFVDILPLRADAANPASYGGPSVAQVQRAAYPDIGPLVLPDPPALVFERALTLVKARGWALVGSDATAGRIEATAVTPLMRFKDDIVI